MFVVANFWLGSLPALTGHVVSSEFSSVTYNRLQAGCYRTLGHLRKSIITTWLFQWPSQLWKKLKHHFKKSPVDTRFVTLPWGLSTFACVPTWDRQAASSRSDHTGLFSWVPQSFLSRTLSLVSCLRRCSLFIAKKSSPFGYKTHSLFEPAKGPRIFCSH